jgi:Neprosin
MKRFIFLLVGAFLFGYYRFPVAVAQVPDNEEGGKAFVRLQDATQKIRTARFSDYEGRLGVRVDAKAFEEMQKYLLERYEGVETVNSFVRDNTYVDCIKTESQPSVRQQGIREIAKPPLSSEVEAGRRRAEPGQNRYAESPLKLGLKDRFGNPVACPEGTIPMQRITLDMLVRYRTLRDFLAKIPRGRGVPTPPRKDSEFRPDWESTHLHAYGYQYVTNYGGNSWLDLWNPSGDFSLSQQWYVGGSGGNTQTVEGGWQVLPDKYGTNKAVLFIYWTADDYQNTGCYNLDCSGFVQTNSNWYLGGTWDHYSSTGGGQWGFELQWKLYLGNWWLFLKGPGNFEAVGYYPTSIYKGGQLATNSTLIEYGGEVARKTGDIWPQMGSGAQANAGWQYAAYQNTIFYIPKDIDDGVGVWASLMTSDETLASCFTIDYVSANSGSTWGTYIFFGGPGASTCN